MGSLADMWNGLSNIVNGTSTPTDPTIPKPPRRSLDAISVLLGEDVSKDLATVIPRVAANVASAPFDIYGLAGRGLDWATGGRVTLPGTEGAQEISQTIHEPVQQFAEGLTGKPINESLISGTPSELAASWSTLALSSILKAPTAITRQVDAGINALEAGKGVAAKTGEIATKSLEMLSPVLLREPTPLVAAGNVAVPAALGVTLDALFPNKQNLDEAAKSSTDTAISGAQTASQSVDAVKPVNASLATGNWWIDGTVLGVGAVAALAAMKRDAFDRVLIGMGQKEKTGLNAVDALRTQYVDRGVPLKETYGDLMQRTQGANAKMYSDIFANRVDSSQGSAIDTKLLSVYKDGEIPGSAIRLMPPTDFYNKLRVADTPTIDTIKANLDTPRAQWTALQPEVQSAVREFDGITQRMIDYAAEQRYYSPKRALELQAMTPHEAMTTMMEGERYVKELRKQNLPLKTDPLDVLPRFIESTIRKVEWNKVQNIYTTALRDAADNGDALAQKILGRRDIALGKSNRDTTVMYRDHNGIIRTQEFNDALVRDAFMNGMNISKLHAVGGLMARGARGFEQSATGVIATAAMQPFAQTAALYNAIFGGALRERGTYAGYIDRALQEAGFKFGLPGDPTLILDSAWRALQGFGAISAKRVADTLHNSIVSGGIISNAMTPNGAQNVATALSNMYKRSWVSHFQQQGLLGPAAMEGINADVGIKYVQNRLATAKVPFSVARDTYGFVKDILHAVSSSPGASIYMLNKNLPADLRARAVREFAGDPARAGAFRGGVGSTLAHGTSWTPWGNIFIQSTDKFARAVAKDPLSAAVGMSVSVGIPTISAALWNASLGEEYANYQYNQRNPDRQASSIYIGLPGLAPEQGLEFPIDPLMRPFKLGMELLAGLHLGLMDGSLFDPANEGLKSAYTEMVRNRWLSMGDSSVASSVVSQTLIPPVMPPISAGAALMGKNLRNYGEVQEIHSRNNNGFTESDARDPTRTMLGLPESSVAESVVRALGANAGAMAYNMVLDTSKRIQEEKPIVKNMWQTLKLGASDSGKAVSGALFGSFASVSPAQDSSSKLVSEKVKGLKQLSQAFQAVTSQGALTGGEVIGNKKQGYQEFLGGNMAILPNDPKMLVLSQMAQIYLRQVQDQFLTPNNTLYQQRNSIQASTEYSPERKRAHMNMIGEEIVARNRQLLQVLQQFESAVSSTIGAPIKLDKIKIGEDINSQEGG